MIKTGAAKPSGGKTPSTKATAYISTNFTTKKNQSSKTPVGPCDQDFQTFGQTIEDSRPKEPEFDIEKDPDWP